GERHAAQRQPTALAAVELARLGENERRVEEGKGAHLVLARRDRLEIGVGDGDGGEPSRLDRRHDAANPERLWLDRLLHRDPPPTIRDRIIAKGRRLRQCASYGPRKGAAACLGRGNAPSMTGARATRRGGIAWRSIGAPS